MQHDIPVAYVPARNKIFLFYALAWAEVVGASQRDGNKKMGLLSLR